MRRRNKIVWTLWTWAMQCDVWGADTENARTRGVEGLPLSLSGYGRLMRIGFRAGSLPTPRGTAG